jgi:predicted amidohydrolase
MKLLLIQTDIDWLSPLENRLRAGELIDASPASDLIVLPEMFTTGFVVSPEGVAEPDGGAETLAWMQRLAASRDAAVAGSVAVDEAGRYYNRLFFVRPDGSFAKYDKRHLFSFAGEHERYTRGTERVTVEWRGWRILLQVCYDLRFPVFARNRGDYDMMLCVANWPTVRIHPWNTLLRARAIENVCYVAGVNRTGEDPYASYSGGTALVDFRGETLAAPDPGSREAVLCEADMEALRAFRAKFPALDDADDFNLTIR